MTPAVCSGIELQEDALRARGKPTDYRVEGEIAYIAIRNRKKEVVAEAIVDADQAASLCQYRWSLGAGGYIKRGAYDENGKYVNVYLHRELMRPPQGMTVDHINRNALDNRLVNLRVCSQLLNSANRTKKADCASRFKGVWKHRDCWRAAIMTAGKSISLGIFKLEEEAARAYDAKAREFWGEYALLNLPEEQ